MKVALVYIRLSGRDADKQASPEMQLARSIQVVGNLKADFNAAEDLFDEGIGLHSAFKRTKLPEFERMTARAFSDPGVGYIVSYDTARIFRNLAAFLNFIRQLDEAGLEWHTATKGRISLEEEGDRVSNTIQAMFDEEESRRASRRMKDHYQALRERGVYTGHHAPFGLKREGKAPRVTLAPNDDLPIVVRLFEVYSRGGVGAAVIAQTLHDAGYMWKNKQKGSRRILGSDVARVLSQLEFYQPFLDPLLYRLALRNRDLRANRKENRRAWKATPTFLAGRIRCSLCQTPLVSTSRLPRWKTGYTNPSYRHPDLLRVTPKCPWVYRTVAANMPDAQVWDEINRLPWGDEEREAATEALSKQRDSARKEYEDKKASLEGQLERLQSAWVQGFMAREFYFDSYERLTKELGDLKEPKETGLSPEEAAFLASQLTLITAEAQGADPLALQQIARTFLEYVTWDFDNKKAKCYPREGIGVDLITPHSRMTWNQIMERVSTRFA